MLFGNNPWTAGAFRSRQPVAQPLAQPTPQAPSYPAPTWPGQTPDGLYAMGLAQNYAGQLQNQQVPGSVVPQMMPPQAVSGAPPQQQVQPDWRDAFRAARADWRGQRPDDHGDLFAQWRMSKPMRQTFQGGGY